jgi:cell division septation protein DedD
MGNKIKFSNYDIRSYYAIHRHYMASLKYNYVINEDKGLSVYPLAVVRYAPSVPLQFDVNAVLNWQKYGWFALAYKSGNALGVNLGVRVFDNLSAGYAYDISIGKIGTFPGATHEITFRYSFGKSNAEVSNVPPTDVSDLQTKLTESEARITKNEEEIAKLKQQLEEKKPESQSNENNNSENSTNETPASNNDDKLFKKDFSDDFVDDNGVQMEKGYFVVVGSFKNKANAKNATQLLQKKGLDAKWILNFKKEFINVYISKPASREQAIEDVNKARTDYPDAWILELE